MNINFLAETLKDIAESGHTIADVVYIGSRDGYSCTWDEFTTLADREYPLGIGGQSVASDLEIHFSDGGWLERWEHEGSEGWEYRPPLVRPVEPKRIERVMVDAEYPISESTLAYMHDEQWSAASIWREDDQ